MGSGMEQRVPTAPGVSLVGLAERAAAAHPSGGPDFDAEALYRGLVEQLPAVVYLDPVDERLDSLYVSPQIEDLIGVTQQEWLSDSRCWSRHVHPDDLDRAWEEYAESVERNAPLSREYRMIHEDGTVKWVLERAVPVPAPDGTPWLFQGMIFDVTGQRDAEEMAFLAYHDKLTGLPNRSLFEEMLGLALGRARRTESSVAVLFLDLDNFKQVNDTLGHQEGDRLLTELTERIKPALRDSDMFARRSGDEFLVMLSDLRTDEVGREIDPLDVAESVAERIGEALATPFDVGESTYRCSASIGISLFPRDASDAQSLLKHADEAMYRSKRERPGGFSIYGVGARGRGDLPPDPAPMGERIRRAVLERAWVLHWQPVVDLEDDRVVGVEALIRWRDQNGGLVPPGEFLPLAEEMGLIESIGEWVVEELCAQDRGWRGQGIELQLGFNLSPRQLWSPRLAETLLGSLRSAGVDPRRVTVEVSESTAMTDPDRVQKVLYELRAWGLGIAIDDFGTGHASLARMSVLPADVLKIDRSLIRGIDGDPDLVAMVRATIALASSLEIAPLAVGVERETEALILKELGCRYAQGFLFGRPLPGDRIPALVSEARRPANAGIPDRG